MSPPKRLTKQEAREALPEELRQTFDKLCEETLYWSQYYYGTTFISYSILKELVEDGWTKHPPELCGHETRYRITVRNNGSSAVDNVKVFDSTPAYTTYTSVNPAAVTGLLNFVRGSSPLVQ